ncbi:GNAT family N-acetyltransferase [Phyllobacterium phragmitis]|uniref:GNAT family N-acetyltransferase n=1 Tax=Phyllobacterium phragmitis TaxID=2670329 RepID=A0A2S9IRN0_9HYPH|nr:GNAT family N-acetyltransferase [Phyllobacterium phragmitis]PRD43169.1 GNAT family N-acetyltransferase [Phyllobacterium phragmitis]
MDLKVPETLHVDAFQMRFAHVADVDLEQLHALSIAVGWPHRAEDWQYLRELGDGFVALDDIGRVMGSAMWFRHGEHFATLGMLITSPRLQTNGTAKWLMQRVLAECPGMSFRLNATRAARRLYRSLDFVTQQTVFQCQGKARKPDGADEPPTGHEIRQLRASDLDAVIAFDAPGFAVPRPVHLARLFVSSLCYGLFRGRELRACSMSRAFGRGHVLGPIAALSVEEAIAVARPQVAVHAGRFLRVDTHFEGGPFASFIQRCGLPIFDTVTTMTLGDGVDYGTAGDESAVLFALASQSLG